MVAGIFILAFAAVIWQARTQPCNGLYPGLQKQFGSLPSTLESIGCLPSIGQAELADELSSLKPLPAIRPTSGPMIETCQRAIVTNPESCGSPIGSAASRSIPRLEGSRSLTPIDSNCLPKQSLVLPPNGPIFRPLPNSPVELPVESTYLAKQSSLTSIDSNCLPKQLPVFQPNGPILRPNLPNSCELPRVLPKPNFVNPITNSNPSISTVIYDSAVANSLADSLQLLILNDLIESTLDYVPLVPETVPIRNIVSQSSVSSASANAATLNSGNSVVTEASSTASSVNLEPYKQPFPNQYGGLNNLVNTPRISEVVNPINVDTNRGFLSNAFGGQNNLATPILPELTPVNIEPLRGPYPNINGGLNNLVTPLPGLGVQEVLNPLGPRFCGVPNIRPTLSITEIPQPITPIAYYNGIQSYNPIAASLNEIAGIINTLGPLVEIADSLYTISNLYNSVPSLSSSSIAEAEVVSTTPALVVEELANPVALLPPTEIIVPVTSSATAVAETLTPSLVSIAESASVVSNAETECVDPIVLADESVVASSLAEAEVTSSSSTASVASAATAATAATTATAAAAATTATSESTAVVVEEIPVATPVETVSSSASCSTSEAVTPVISAPITSASPFNLGISPISLAIELPSSLPPCYGTRSMYGLPVAYELEIPSSIPAQLSCSLGVVPTTTPVVSINVEPLSLGYCGV